MARFSVPLTAASAAAAALLLLVVVTPVACAFAPAPKINAPAAAAATTTTSAMTALCVFPVESADVVADAVLGSGTDSATTLLSMVEGDDMANFYKSAVIVLLFGGGLIPPAIAANKAMFDTLTSKRPEKKELTEEEKKTCLDPTFGAADYVESSGATGPSLPVSPLLFAPEKIPLADVIAIVGRISDVNSVADWRSLPSTRLPGAINPDNPPMWLPRATFKANVRKAKFGGWPLDDRGRPVGGEDLRDAELKRISSQGAVIGDAALDAVFDTWAWGANIATPDKVSSQLRSWRGGDLFDLGKFSAAAVSGRAVTGFGALTFIVIQIVAYGALFIAPALRTFLDIDIGFGELGACDPETCVHLFRSL